MKSPRGKAELLNRLFSFDFNGDWKNLGEGVQITRVKPHIASFFFPDTGRTLQLVARIPRGERPKKRATKVSVAEGKLPSTAPPAPPRRKRQAVTH